MSRCFPYPPPGFERNERSHQPDLLAKERHKEKKHKKDKERKEGKERKDKEKHKDKKDRKEKHKDKKRDKDRDKNKTSDDKRFEEQNDGHNEQKVPFGFPKSEEVKDSRFTVELGRRIRDEQEGAAKRMFETITGQIREGVEALGPASVREAERTIGKPVVADFISKEKHRVDGVINIAASVWERERANGQPIVTNFTNKEHHRADGFASTATAPQQESDNGNPMVPNFASKKQRKGESIDCAARPLEKGNSNHQVLPRLSVENGNGNHQVFPRSVEKGNDNHQVFPLLSVEKGNESNDNHPVFPRLSVENGNDNHQLLPQLSVEKGINNNQVLPRLSMEKGSNNHQVLPRLSMEKGSNNHQVLRRLSVEKGNDNHQVLPPLPVGKDALKKFQGKEKAKIREMDDGKGEKPRERDQEAEKNKGKDTIKDREKKKERGKTDDKKGHRHKDRDQEKKKSKGKDKDKNRKKEKEKEEKKSAEGENKHKGHDRPKDIGESSQPDSRKIKPLAPHIPNGTGERVLPDRQNSNTLALQLNSEQCGGNDDHSKKRKHIETNGFLHEDAVRPNKALKPGFSLQQPLEIGMKLEMSQLPSYPSMLHVTPNNVKDEKTINRKEHKINGITQAQPCPIDSRPPLAAESGKNRTVPRPPHPDSKYLSEVYSVPQMEEWPATDDQEWLRGSSNPHPKPAAREPPQVWAQGLQVEMADVFALPYVIPY